MSTSTSLGAVIESDFRALAAERPVSPGLRVRLDADRARAESARSIRIPAYCSYCKGHISGPDAAGGSEGMGVSHGICGPCKEMVLAGLSIRTIQEVREIELRVQLEALRKELGKGTAGQ